MSSIYKKGRDGYYYYQTYVYNPESKKKDKRIFHALGTKDLIEAKEKQNKFDKKYENIELSNSGKLFYFINKPLKVKIAVSALIIVSMIYIHSLRKTENEIRQDASLEMKKENGQLDQEKKLKHIGDSSPTKRSMVSKTEELIENKPIIDFQNAKIKMSIPKFRIERIERLSDAFDQGKIYVTLNIDTDNASQLLLCDSLARRFDEFSNIVICLYADNEIGINIAKGYINDATNQEKRHNWLAMYTYNSVEGKYFDDNPGEYLGI